MRIGIDIMGSDSSPEMLFESILLAAAKLPTTTKLTVIATEEYVKSLSCKIVEKDLLCSIQFSIARECITMGDSPLASVRSKKNSSLFLGLKLLKMKDLDAFVTAGNTGALIAGARLILTPLPRIKRPALLALLPTQNGRVAIIDVGGSVSCKVAHLVQFAKMGVAYMQCAENVTLPRVGLLNIGVESKKGTSNLQQVYQELMQYHKKTMNFVGNIEARDVFKGYVDVLVTDGFTGNVLLKASEGVAELILENIKDNFGDQQLQRLQNKFNYSEYPGAILVGVDGVIVKCHGEAHSHTICQSIVETTTFLKKHFIDKMKMILN